MLRIFCKNRKARSLSYKVTDKIKTIYIQKSKFKANQHLIVLHYKLLLYFFG